MAYTVVLSGGTPWGFRLQGGKEFEEEFTIAKINPNSKAYNEGIQVGDYVDRINGDPTHGLMHNEALQLIRNASDKLELELRRGNLSNTSNTLPRAKSRLNGDVNHNLPGYWSGDEGEQEGDHRHINYKPVSFGTSPRPGSQPSPTAPAHLQQQSMDLGVNSEQADLSQPLPYSNSTLTPTAPTSKSAPNPGVWSLDYKPDFLKKGRSLREENRYDRDVDVDEDDDDEDRADSPLIWSPTGRPTSPRKEYRPIRLDAQGSKPDVALGLKPMDRTTTASSTGTTSTMTNMAPSLSTSTSPTWNGTISHFSESKSGLPTPQSPTVTLLQKGRDEESRNDAPAPGMNSLMVNEGALPRGALYMGTKETVEGDVKHTDTFYMVPGEKKTTTTTIEKKAPRVAGVGPKDKDTGMPVSLRMTVDEKNQKDWYKQMYKSLHTDHKPKKKKVPTATLR